MHAEIWTFVSNYFSCKICKLGNVLTLFCLNNASLVFMEFLHLKSFFPQWAWPKKRNHLVMIVPGISNVFNHFINGLKYRSTVCKMTFIVCVVLLNQHFLLLYGSKRCLFLNYRNSLNIFAKLPTDIQCKFTIFNYWLNFTGLLCKISAFLACLFLAVIAPSLSASASACKKL